MLEKISTVIKNVVKGIFWLKWRDDLNVVQNLFLNIYLPDSSGKPSMHVTILVIVMSITMLTLWIELHKWWFNGVVLSVGFWATLGSIVVVIQTAFSYSDKTKKDRENHIEDKALDIIKNGSPTDRTIATGLDTARKMVGMPSNPNLED